MTKRSEDIKREISKNKMSDVPPYTTEEFQEYIDWQGSLHEGGKGES